MKLLEIFKAGKHVDASGVTREFSESDLVASAAAYSPSLHEAPLTIGHPQHDDPAYGWVDSVDVKAGSFLANPKQVDAKFAEAVKAGKFKKISASFYAPDSPNNPVKGVYYLRHVGFLGAMPPAVKGMKSVDFAEQEEGVVEFAEIDFMDWDDLTVAGLFSNLREWIISKFDLETADRVVPIYAIDQLKMSATQEEIKPEMPMDYSETKPETADFAERENFLALREAEIVKREAKLTETEFSEYCDRLITEGKVYPREKSQVVATLVSLAKLPEAVEFAEGEGELKTSSLLDAYKSSLQNRPKVIDFAELPSEVVIPTNPEEQAKQIQARYEKAKADGKPITFAEAQTEVLQGK